MLLVEEKASYGNYGWLPKHLNRYGLNLNLNLTETSKPKTTSSLGWLNPSKYSLNVNMPSWLRPTPSIKPIVPKKTLVRPSIVTKTMRPKKTSFFSSIKSGFSSLFHSIGGLIGQVAPMVIQYNLAKQQMKMEANLARLKLQSQLQAGAGYPTGQQIPDGYPNSYPVPTNEPAPNGYPAQAYAPSQPSGSNMGKYLLIGGGVLAAVLLVTMMHRD